MPVFTQLYHALIASPFIIKRGKKLFFLSLLLYLTVGLIVFGSFSYYLIKNQDAIRQAVMSYFLPESWHFISDKLAHFFFESQTKTVLASMIISGSLVVASIILFPIKEYCSAKFELESEYNNGPKKEFPLWMQALEECKLFALYITAQSIIFAIGYYPYSWCSWTSNILSVLFLCFSFGLDFISPTLQRHRIRYTSIIKLLLKNIFITVGFGAVFSIPILLLGRWILHVNSMDLAEISATLFIINIFILAIAIPAGTHLASQLMPYTRTLHAPSIKAKKLGYGIMATLMVLGVSFHSLVAMSMHHKSQFLKCAYDIDRGSMDLDMPSFSELARGEKDATLSFDLNIYNPTDYDLIIESSHLNIWQNGHLISRTLITELDVSNGETVNQPMSFKMHLDTKLLSGFRNLTKGWTVQVELELLPGIPFIVQVL